MYEYSISFHDVLSDPPVSMAEKESLCSDGRIHMYGISIAEGIILKILEDHRANTFTLMFSRDIEAVYLSAFRVPETSKCSINERKDCI